jgi:hypothetical protein
MQLSKATIAVLVGALVIATSTAIIRTGGARQAQAQTPQVEQEEPSKLGVLWTSGDREVALKMVFMYTFNAKRGGWWDEVRFIVWGPSSKLLSVDQELQAEVKKMGEAGVELVACKACADLYGVSDKLTELGIDVKYMGRPLTSMLKSDWEVITF